VYGKIYGRGNHEQNHHTDRPKKEIEGRLGNSGFASFARFCHDGATGRKSICSKYGRTSSKKSTTKRTPMLRCNIASNAFEVEQ
jgi:hypothetical protein